MAKRVVILGGGVAGMSAAHHLLKSGGFDIHVYERKKVAGGKARSVSVKGTGKDGRRDLPGEHGFRFFPRFYKHLPDTMKQIPFGDSNVEKNLIQTTRLEYPRKGKAPIVLADRFPTTLDGWKLTFKAVFDTDWGFKPGEREFFAERLWQIVTSCEDRRLDEYERLPWWDFVDASKRSPEYQKYLAGGLTRSLNAAQATRASTKTIGDILIQLLLDVVTPGMSSDRLLNGPTNDRWIDPWLQYLRKNGVTYDFDSKLTSINIKDGRISSATVEVDGRTEEVTGDFYIVAVPVEVMATLVTDEILNADRSLKGIRFLYEHKMTQWMNGIQFYLKEDVPIVHGHELYVDSTWALTSVSQAQFWPDYNIQKDFGDGEVKGVLSVDISEWEVNGSKEFTGSKEHPDGAPAWDCTPEQIANETWHQLKDNLNVNGRTILTDDMLHSWFLDPDIRPDQRPHPQHLEANMEPLLVNLVNSWQYRPDAHTRIPNLFLAADYVKTYTDLATMEGANEAARRAVNCILDATGSSAEKCELWKLHEPDVIALWRSHDQERYNQGLPWNGHLGLPSGCGALFQKIRRLF